LAGSPRCELEIPDRSPSAATPYSASNRARTLLTRHGFKTAVMKADRVEPKQHEAWVAKRVKEGIDVPLCQTQPVKVVFMAYRNTLQADALLVDDGWQRPAAEAETLVSALPSDGEAAPVVELLPCANHHGQGKQQQSLFSWAEFLAEQPEQPIPRARNTRSSGPSLFVWTLEREQEAGPVAAGG